jgi:hypothetical protein
MNIITVIIMRTVNADVVTVRTVVDYADIPEVIRIRIVIIIITGIKYSEKYGRDYN